MIIQKIKIGNSLVNKRIVVNKPVVSMEIEDDLGEEIALDNTDQFPIVEEVENDTKDDYKEEIKVVHKEEKVIEKVEENDVVDDVIVSEIIMDKELIMDKGEKVKLKYEIVPYVDNAIIKFNSDNSIVNVSEDGEIEGVDYGNSIVSACIEEKCSDMIVKVVQRELVSSVYKIDRDNSIVISREPNVSVIEFFDNFLNDNEFLKLDSVGTGMEIKLVIQGIDYDLLKLCIIGDLNGDGLVTVSDSEILKNILLESEEYDEIVYVAADIDGDGIIGMPDDNLMKKYINGEIENFL